MFVCCETYGKSVLQTRESDRIFSTAKLFFAYHGLRGVHPWSIEVPSTQAETINVDLLAFKGMNAWNESNGSDRSIVHPECATALFTDHVFLAMVTHLAGAYSGLHSRDIGETGARGRMLTRLQESRVTSRLHACSSPTQPQQPGSRKGKQ